MQVKCVLCDSIEDIYDFSIEAKRLKNRKNSLYLCSQCYERISEKTKKRYETGKFHLYKEKENNDLI